METRTYNNNLLASLLTPSFTQNNTNGNAQTNSQKQPPLPNGDSVKLSQKAQSAAALNQTRLISETTESIDNGIRRTQVFENAKGRKFVKVEELTTNEQQSRRIVVQQNASGSTNKLEDVFDRQEDGSFRLTQRFTNEIGETSVNINPNTTPPSTDFILGRAPSVNTTSPAYASRGNEVNVVI